jgi:metal dependent phosphohydrolase
MRFSRDQIKDIIYAGLLHDFGKVGVRENMLVKASEDKISIQSKMMMITAIFDALTAQDRPYKKETPHERALEIIGYEVKVIMLTLIC